MIFSAGLSPAWQQFLVFDSFRYGEVNRGDGGPLVYGRQSDQRRQRGPSPGRAEHDAGARGRGAAAGDASRVRRVGCAVSLDRNRLGHTRLYHDPRSGHAGDDRTGRRRSPAFAAGTRRVSRGLRGRSCPSRRGDPDRLAAAGYARVDLSRVGCGDRVSDGARFSWRGDCFRSSICGR